MNSDEKFGLWFFGFLILFGLSNFAAWVTHIVRCLTEEQWGFLIAGAIMFPVACIHGWLIWFGAV